MATSKYAIFGMIVCTLLTAAGQILLKKGIDSFTFDLLAILRNYSLVLALLLYGAGLVVMTVSFKYGEISVLYPVVTLSFVWVAVFSSLILGESLNAFKISAVLLIIIGISLIGKGGVK